MVDPSPTWATAFWLRKMRSSIGWYAGSREQHQDCIKTIDPHIWLIYFIFTQACIKSRMVSGGYLHTIVNNSHLQQSRWWAQVYPLFTFDKFKGHLNPESSHHLPGWFCYRGGVDQKWPQLSLFRAGTCWNMIYGQLLHMKCLGRSGPLYVLKALEECIIKIENN